MAIVSPYMGLKVWNEVNDQFDHIQLGENLAKVDMHDHTEGKGVKIPTAGIEDGAISAAKLGVGSVTDEKIAKVAVRGYVPASGGGGYGTGFTVTHPSTGNYTITFAPELSFTTKVIPVATLVFVAGYITWNAFSPQEMKIETFNTSNAATNIGFTFAVYPL